MKYTWHVKWRLYNPISWILCWLFEQNVALMPEWFFYLHDWFCPEEQEVQEEYSREELDKRNKENFIPLDKI